MIRKMRPRTLSVLEVPDDIFMICEHSKEDFYKFVKMLNTHHPSIIVKAE